MNTLPVYEWYWSVLIKKFIRKNSLAILHVHDLYMAKAAFKGIRKVRKQIPIVLDLHENYPFTITTYNWTKGFLRSIISQPGKWASKEKQYLRYADRIIVLSNDFKELLTDRYPELPEENFTVLPNVPDLSQLKQKRSGTIKNPFKQSFPIILYYGVIAERRGVFDALEVFINLVEENYQVNLLFIGPVDKKDRIRFLEQINLDLLTDRVKYIPWIDSSELTAYLEIIDICIAPFHKNPQHESGIANKIYEYMLGGKPVVASNCKPQQELIEKHNCGLIFGNISEFKSSIIRLLEESDLRAIMGKNGHEAIIREYHTEIAKESLLLLYKTITNK